MLPAASPRSTMPGAFVVIGDSVAAAQDKRAQLDSKVHDANAIATLSIMID